MPPGSELKNIQERTAALEKTAELTERKAEDTCCWKNLALWFSFECFRQDIFSYKWSLNNPNAVWIVLSRSHAVFTFSFITYGLFNCFP